MKTLRSLLPVLLLALLAGCATVSPPPAPSKAEADALAVLSTSADVHEKARACQELANMGGPASVPALAALLADEKLSDYARSPLESIRDASAGKALRDALPTLQGRQLAGVVNSLGVRREKAAVADLKALALDTKRGAAPAAVGALGLIATPDAAQALQQMLTGPTELRLPAAHASLIAADRLARDGNATAARSLLEAVTKAQPDTLVAQAAKNQAATLAKR